MGDCFVPRSDISFGLLEKTFLDSYITAVEIAQLYATCLTVSFCGFAKVKGKSLNIKKDAYYQKRQTVYPQSDMICISHIFIPRRFDFSDSITMPDQYKMVGRNFIF
jgi:hypothetical protein